MRNELMGNGAKGQGGAGLRIQGHPRSPLLVTFCCLLLLLLACSRPPATLDEIRDRGLLYIGVDPSYPPFAALAPDGGLYGLDVDLGRELAQQLGVEPHYVLMGYDGLYHSLAVGEVDLLISAVVVDPGRMDQVAYSHSYFDVGVVLAVPAARQDELKNVRDLTGRTVAVEYASEAHVEAKRWARRLGELELQTYTTAEEALAAVSSGAAEAALVDSISARLYLREHPALALAPDMVLSQPLAIALRSEDKSLLRAVNNALDEISLEELLARWF